MTRKPVSAGLFILALACLFAFPTCQDYGFEELPSSVIREKRVSVTISAATEVDILFVMDNSRSMVGEQRAIAQSFSSFVGVLDEKFGEGKYRIAVITTGMESDPGCLPCPVDQPNVYSCTNETGENGRFQDRLGKNNSIDDTAPDYVFEADESCRVMDSTNVNRCFYNVAEEKGVILVGVNGCGYEKGLAPMKAALSDSLLDNWNKDFLRPNATLAVVVISDEEDCGEVGDITESMQGISGWACYYAAKGIAPNGDFSDPEVGLLYQLTPVREYYDFLVDLKGGRESMVKFVAIVGIEDPANPSATEITYDGTDVNSRINTVCETPDCTGGCNPGDTICVDYCRARPGTRYVALAELFGLGDGGNGFVSTLCLDDFSDTMVEIGNFVSCPREFKLSEEILDPGLANILINGESVPRYSCSGSTKDNIMECTGRADTSCTAGDCIETWSYAPPDLIADPNALGGVISFAEHYDPCDFIADGEIHIELIYVTP